MTLLFVKGTCRGKPVSPSPEVKVWETANKLVRVKRDVFRLYSLNMKTHQLYKRKE